MKRSTKFWLIAAAALLLIGGLIFAGGMSILKWDFTKLSFNEYQTNAYTVGEEYGGISIVTDTADVELVISNGSETSVVCYEQITGRHSVSVKDGVLVIELKNTKKWYEYIGIDFGTPKITLTLPAGGYGDLGIKLSTGNVNIPSGLGFENIDITASTGAVTNRACASGDIKIKTSTGRVVLEDISAASLDLSTSTGKVKLDGIDCRKDINIKVSTGKTEISDAECRNLISNGSTGSVTLTNVIATEGFSLERSTGNVKFEGCDATELHIETDTGDVKGSLLSEKVFITETDTGRIDVPKTTVGGICEIGTDTGDIKITVE